MSPRTFDWILAASLVCTVGGCAQGTVTAVASGRDGGRMSHDEPHDDETGDDTIEETDGIQPPTRPMPRIDGGLGSKPSKDPASPSAFPRGTPDTGVSTSPVTTYSGATGAGGSINTGRMQTASNPSVPTDTSAPSTAGVNHGNTTTSSSSGSMHPPASGESPPNMPLHPEASSTAGEPPRTGSFGWPGLGGFNWPTTPGTRSGTRPPDAGRGTAEGSDAGTARPSDAGTDAGRPTTSPPSAR